MVGITEKLGSGFHRFENAGLTFDAQGDFVNAGAGGDKAHQAFGLMRIEIIGDEMPFGHVRFGFHGAADVVQIIRLSAGRSRRNGSDPAGGHIEIDDKGQRPVPNVLELPPFHFTGLKRQAGMFPFQSLDPGHLIVTDNPLPLPGQFLRPVIKTVDVGVSLLKLLPRLTGQPITVQVRLDIGVFLKDVRRDGLKSSPLCRA